MNRPITIELDHINGNRSDNSRENLRLLCPNCHALTPTYRGKNIGEKAKKNWKIKREKIYQLKIKQGTHQQITATVTRKISFGKKHSCIKCGNILRRKTKTNCCAGCVHKSARKVVRPPVSVLIQEVKTSSFLAVGRKYGVSDNAIRKWLKNEGVDPKIL